MGMYIDLVGRKQKINWLEENAIPLTQEEAHQEYLNLPANGLVIVCLVENGLFDALAIGSSPWETAHFLGVTDTRYKSFWLLEIEKLKQPEVIIDSRALELLFRHD